MADTVRTVSVALKMQITDFESGAAKAEIILEGLSAEVDNFGKKSKTGFDGASKASSDFSRLINKSLQDGKTGFESIQIAIDNTKKHILDLQHQVFTSPGSDSLFGDLKSAKNDLRTLENVFKDLAPAAEKAGVNAGNSLLNGLENSVSSFSLGPLSGPIGLGIVAAATPIIISGLSAAISAGVGLGVIGLAAAIDHNNPLIVKSFTTLKDDAVNVFKDAADPLAAPLAHALSSFDDLLHKEEPQIRALFTAAGQSIGPLTTGLEKLTEDLLPTMVKDAQSFNAALKDPQVQASLIGVEKSFTGLMDALGDPRLVKQGFIVIDALLGTTLTMLQGIVAASQVAGDSIHYLSEAASWVGKIFTAGPDTQTPALQSRAQVWERLGTGAQDLGKAASSAAPPVGALGNKMEAAGVAAGNSYPDIAAVGKSMASMGEHAGTTTPAVQAIGNSMQSMGEHASTSIPAVDAIGKSMTSMGEHAGTSNSATQALGFSVSSLGEHAGTSDPAVLAVGKSMQSMGEHAGTANKATQAVGFSVQSLGEHAGLANPATAAVGKSMQSMGEHSGAATAAVKGLTSAQQKNTGATIGELQAFAALDTQLNSTFDSYMNVEKATISVKQAQADLEKQLGRGKKSWDLDKQAGRDNMNQLLDSIGTDKSAYDARVKLEGATKKNTTAYDHEVDALLATASKAGLSRSEVAKLRKEFEALPPSVTIPVNVHIKVTGDTGTAGVLTGRTINRWGGLYTHADVGLVSAHVAQATNPARYAYAEPQTGGEAFIPKFGNYGRSMSILSAAAGWYGARVTPNGGGGGSTRVEIGFAPGAPSVLRDLIRVSVQQSGGDVVKALTPR